VCTYIIHNGVRRLAQEVEARRAGIQASLVRDAPVLAARIANRIAKRSVMMIMMMMMIVMITMMIMIVMLMLMNVGVCKLTQEVEARRADVHASEGRACAAACIGITQCDDIHDDDGDDDCDDDNNDCDVSLDAGGNDGAGKKVLTVVVMMSMMMGFS
jgi:hypothetical protein